MPGLATEMVNTVEFRYKRAAGAVTVIVIGWREYRLLHPLSRHLSACTTIEAVQTA
jgi:hypothetical protein